jgi:hypothetical protein
VISRRRFLRGVLGGATVTTSLPLLDIFLNDNGTALADTGANLPVRFGTWFWGCGVNPDRWVPVTDGADFELPPEMLAIAPVREHINVLTGYDAKLDGKANAPHHTGVVATLTGAPSGVEEEYPAPTLDTIVSAFLGAATRFRSLEVAADNTRSHSYSRLSSSVINQSEISPIALYHRLFGLEFVDPDAGPFEVDPRVQLRKSVLSALMEDATRLDASLGSHDRQRMDQYFTSVREMEKRLDFMLSGPPDLAACSKPDEVTEEELGVTLDRVVGTHAVMADLLALALACDQTRVVNVVFSWGLSALRIAGTYVAHHDITHNEAIDPVLGYQPAVLPFIMASMDAWALFVERLAAVPEGDGTLLDNCLIMAHSETSLAQSHDVRNLPVMTAGKAGGKLKTGLHVRGNGDPITRIGLTVQQLVGQPVARWGTGSMDVSSPITELLV